MADDEDTTLNSEKVDFLRPTDTDKNPIIFDSNDA